MSIDTIQSLLEKHVRFDSGECCVVITRDQCPANLVGLDRLTWRDDVNTVADLGQLGRQSVAIVSGQFEHMDKDRAVHLLAQLRDVHAERVLVCDERGVFTAAELLALGYLEHECPRGGHLYLHDPGEFFQRREWNNPRNWANPGNYDKYRW